MPAKAKWRKVGWRSLRHNGKPDMVVRFSNGVGKAKMMELPPHGAAWNKEYVDSLLVEATAEWQRINNQTERIK